MIDQYLGAIYGESSTIPPSHGKKVAPCIPSSCPRGRIQPPRSTGFPCSPLKDKDESLPFNHQKYPHKRGNIYQPYASLSDVQSRAQKKGERFKDLYIRDLVITGRLKWRGKFHNVETSHFQEEWVARGLELEHDQEEGMVPIVDTCLGYSAVLGAELFSEQERMEEEVRTSHLVVWSKSDILLQSATLRRNIADLEKRYLELEKVRLLYGDAQVDDEEGDQRGDLGWSSKE